MVETSEVCEALCDVKRAETTPRNMHHNALFEISQSAMNSLFETTTTLDPTTLDEEYTREVLQRALSIAEQLVIVLKAVQSTSNC